MAMFIAALQKELKPLNGNRAESRWQVLIARIQCFFNLPGQDG